MTNKQVIDGINVSGCKLYRDEISFVGGEIHTDVCSIWIWQRDYSGLEPSCVMKCHCKDNPNCLFKKLARKTQECQQLTNKNNRLEEELNTTKLLLEGKNNQYVAKTQECEELQYQLRCVTAREKGHRKNSDFWEKHYEKLEEQLNQLKTENDMLRDELRFYKDFYYAHN